MKHFKVQKGYHVDDFISIDESELAMALRAQITGKVAVFKEGTVSGNSIMSITPDYNKAMGWNRDYKLGHEDYEQIGNTIMKEYQSFIFDITTEVNHQLSSGNGKGLMGPR